MARQWDFESASGDSAADRMRVLWCPVLNQAISDAFGDIRRCVAKSEVDRARAFCLAESGKWEGSVRKFAPWLESTPTPSAKK
jgi:hypothetical protein